MARKQINFTVSDSGRDTGKVFVITEMPARQAEQWAFKALLALMNSGAELPEGAEHLGMAGIAQVGIQAFSGLKYEVVSPLLEDMLSCVQFMPDPAKPQLVRKLFDEDIEEVMTLVKLRAEVFKLHVDFSQAGAIFKQAVAPVPAQAQGRSRVIKTSRQ